METSLRTKHVARAGALLASILTTAAQACPICLSRMPEPTLSERLARSSTVVVAESQAGAPGRFRVTTTLKGSTSTGNFIEVTSPAALRRADSGTGVAVLLVDVDSHEWVYVGAVGTETVPLLRRLSAAASNGGVTPARGSQRLAMYAELLEHPDAFIAQAAHAELSQAPYEQLRAIAANVPRERLRGWLATASLDSRQALYLLLLGLARDARDVEYIGERIATGHRYGRSENLSALLAADIELRGASQVSFIERAYLTDHARSGDEIQAALLALSVHGNAPGAVSRQRIIDSYRLLIRERKPMAYFVAGDLAAWNDWGASAEFAALLKSDTLHYASRVAIVNYLRANPAPDRVTAQALRSATRPL